MKTPIDNNEIEEKKTGIYGIQEMIDLVESNPLHSMSKGEIKDYGELCDQDCIDCD